MEVVFVPGAGRDGVGTWPGQSPAALGGGVHATFLTHDELADPMLGAVRTLGDAGAHVVAHSAGAVAATLAAAARPDLVRSLVLFEPACFALTRGGLHVERHIAAMSPVFAMADDASVSDGQFGARFLAALGVPTPLPPEPVLTAMGQRMRTVPAPWSYGQDAAFMPAVRALVVLSGHEHRPQDHEAATQMLLRHWSESARMSHAWHSGSNPEEAP